MYSLSILISMKRYIISHKNQLLYLILILFTAGFLRFIYLDRIPSAISGDELLYVITAKSIFLTGHDITGKWNTLSAFVFRYPPNEQQAELPYFLHVPFSGPFPFSLFTAKLPFALLSVGIVLLLYAISKKLFGEPFGIAAGFIAAINPWLVVMGRTGYESTPATFFYLLALYILLKAGNWRILWSFIPLLLAFYSYIGTKLIFIPFVMLTTVFAYIHNKNKHLKPYIVLNLISIVFIIGFVYLLRTSPTGSRMSELFLPNSPVVAAQVNEIRKNSISSSSLTFMTNKYVVYTQIVWAKLFRIFSPSYLFTEGDQFFLPGRQSFFYAIDSIFLVIGLFSLFVK